jgi:hypothetical protein
MSTAPLLRIYSSADPSHQSLELPESDQALLNLANQDECVVKRAAGARGVVVGITLGAVLWAGIVLAGAALIK